MPTEIYILAGLLALIALGVWRDYRGLCRRDEQRWKQRASR